MLLIAHQLLVVDQKAAQKMASLLQGMIAISFIILFLLFVFLFMTTPITIPVIITMTSTISLHASAAAQAEERRNTNPPLPAKTPAKNDLNPKPYGDLGLRAYDLGFTVSVTHFNIQTTLSKTGP